MPNNYNQQVYWNGTSWVGPNGEDLGITNQGDKNLQDPNNYYGANPMDQSRYWVRDRYGISMLLDQYLKNDLPQQLRGQQQRQDLFNQYLQGLDSTQGATRAYQNMMGTTADAGTEATASALALGMDPRANALAARNSAAVSANNAAQKAYDPAAHAQQLQNAMAMSGEVNKPMYWDQLQSMMGFDSANNGPWMQQQIANSQKQSGLGSLLGLVGGAASLGWKPFGK